MLSLTVSIDKNDHSDTLSAEVGTVLYDIRKGRKGKMKIQPVQSLSFV